MAPSLIRRVSTAGSLWLFLMVVLPLLVLPVAAPGLSVGWSSRVKWMEVTDEEIQLAAPKIDPEAGAEILFNQLEVEDSDKGGRWAGRYRGYMRIKVFDAFGVESLSSFEIPGRVSDFAARVIKPDGSIIEIDEEDVFSRVTTRYDAGEGHLTSFAPPALEPGCIVELQWETRNAGIPYGRVFSIARKYPSHLMRFRFRSGAGFTRLTYFLVEGETKEGSGGYSEIDFRDVEAYPDEPYLPPLNSFQPWIAVTYLDDRRGKHATDPDHYWKEICKELANLERDRYKTQRRQLEKKARELTQSADSEREALEWIYAFCTSEIVNLAEDDSPRTAEEWKKLKVNRPSAYILRQGYGNSRDINYLFFSLARAAGFEAYLGYANDRSLIDWTRNSLIPASTPDLLVAVKVDGEWNYFDPGRRFIAFSKQHWSNTSAVVFLANAKQEEQSRIGADPAHFSTIERKAELSLAADGTLKGSVSLLYKGHRAVDVKLRYADKTPMECIELLEKEVRERLPTAVFSNIVFQNLEDRELDAIISFDIEVPGYAEVTQERIFLKTSFFQQGVNPVFRKEERDFDIRFPYAWETQDRVVINYPENYVLEQGAAPQSVSDLDTFYHSALLGVAKNGHRLIFKRAERVSALHVNRDLYPAVKGYFDAMHEQDQHILILRKAEADEGSPEGIPAPDPKL